MATTTSYEASDIQVLDGMEAVRRRPGMYIGDTESGSGMHHMLWEVVANAIDEHLRRADRSIAPPGYVTIDFDGHRVIVEDDGGGIPVDPLPDGTPALEAVMTRMHAGTASRPHVHLRPDLWGIGVAPVCALSSELVAETWRNGRAYVQRYSKGVALGPVEDRGPTTRTGTRVSFTPDFTILTRHDWDRDEIARFGRELAALVPGVTMIVDGDACHYADGLCDHARFLAGGDLVEPFHARVVRDGIEVEVVFAWLDAPGVARGFVNCAPADGIHMTALFAALRTVLMRRVPVLKRASRARMTRNLIALVHARLDHPRFGDPTRDWLTNPEVGETVRAVVETELEAHFARSPAALDWTLLRIERRHRPAAYAARSQ